MGSCTKGIEQICAKIEAAAAKLEHTSEKGLTEAALFVGGEAQKRAPIESGDLRNSMHVELKGSSASVSFNTPYAARQHEDTSLRHDRTDGHKNTDGSTVNMVAGGQSKYLESVLIDYQGEILKMIAGGANLGEGEDDD